MSNAMTMEQLLELLDGDRDLLRHLVVEGIIEETDDGFAPEEVERVLVACTLVRDLEVNWAGVEIILQLRSELLTTRRRLAALLLQRAERSAGQEAAGEPGRIVDAELPRDAEDVERR